MRHVPTALYIDTEVYKRNNLRLDTKDFTEMRKTFVKGGLRLLVPSMMERELLRHFQRRAKDSAKTVLDAHKMYPIPALSLMALPSIKELEDKCFSALQEEWTDFKGHFTVEKLPLVGRLEDIVDWYFREEAPFSEKKPKEFPDAFILSVLETYHRDHGARIAMISSDGDFVRACVTRDFICHFEKLSDYISAFQPEISRTTDSEMLDPMKPITTEDLTEMKSILGRGEDATDIERNRVLSLLSTRGSNFDYFFQKANNAFWIDSLLTEGYFANPPAVEKSIDGRIRIPVWPPVDYLVRIYEQAPDRVIEVLKSFQGTNNPYILNGILDIVIKSNAPALIHQFYRSIEVFIDSAHWEHKKIIDLLAKPYLFDGQLVDVASALLLKIVEFRPDSMAEEKAHQRKTDPSGWTNSLEPAPRFDSWKYQQILDHAVLPLAEREPFAIARVLIDATASMIRLRMHREDHDKGDDDDHSEVWCRRLDRPKRSTRDSRCSLVNALTVACQSVFDRAPESIDTIDQALRNQRWIVFRRLRMLLYAEHPNEQTIPWIRECILSYEDYGKLDYHYEFQLMIRKACEHLGDQLLTEQEREIIFDMILRGPSLESFRNWQGDQYTDEKWSQHQRYFHRKQLQPFAGVLFGHYLTTFEGLEREFMDDRITDESYYLVGEVRSGWVSSRSPRSPDELAALSDDELLAYINKWENTHRDSDDWLVEISIEALAMSFQAVFKDTIVPDASRLAYWIDYKDQVERPVYIKAMVQAMQAITKDHDFEHLEQWFVFCDWIVENHGDARDEEDRGCDQSCKHPDWRSCRRAVGDLVGSCIEEDVNVPLKVRDSLADLLRKLCNQYDNRLDRNRPVLLNRDDQVSEAINNTRSRALEDLVDFAYWVRSHDEKADVPELREILEARFDEDGAHPLTLPERAILGLHFGRICTLDTAWAETNKANFFPQGDFRAWAESFKAFIHFNHPSLPIFEILKDNFVLALNHLDSLDEPNDSGRSTIEILGQHLFTYYLWDVYPLQGNDSLLFAFYDKTANNRIHWGQLFSHVGITLRNSSPKLDMEIMKRILAFFDWRFDQEEPMELQEFTYWLEAVCLDPDWRLDAYSKILGITQAKDVTLQDELDSLNDLLEQHTGKVVECFAKITDRIGQGGTLYIQTAQARPILKAGLKSSDELIRSNAERARENLLRARRFEFLEIEG